MNRVWARYFGRGLVETENDFGLQGTPPTHPELLDWLAAKFMERGLVVEATSSAHSQLGHVPSDRRTIGPISPKSTHSTSCWAGSRGCELMPKLCAIWALRSVDCCTTRLADPAFIRRSPADVFAFTQVRREWPTSTGPERYRRGMYTFFMRSAPYPMLTTFDTPVFNVTCTFRQRSNTPLQSLTMANDETMIEIARALGQRVYQQATSDRDRLDFAFRLCFARPAESFELERLAEYVAQQRQNFAATPEDARKLAGDSSRQSD